MFTNPHRTALAFVLLVVLASQAFADSIIVGPVYPPPGGVTDPWVGDAGRVGGVDITLTNFDLTQSNSLYWGPVLNLYGGDNYSFGLDGSTHPLSLSLLDSNLAGGIATHLGTSAIKLEDANLVQHTTAPTPIRATLIVTDLANGPLSLVDTSTIPGLTGDQGVVHNVTGDFKVNILFEAYWDNALWPSGAPIPPDKSPLPDDGWYPFLDLYDDELPTPPGQAITNLGDGYWYEAPGGFPGDANGDGWVDGLDYLIWAGNFGDDPADDPPGSPGNGDFDDDGNVDGLDYLLWAGNFGQHNATAAPEPNTVGLVAIAVFGLSGWRIPNRRRRATRP
jgi:hypothetical protein